MNQTRRCGCKGWRSCLLCEEEYGIQPSSFKLSNDNLYTYCHICEEAWRGDGEDETSKHPNHKGDKISFPGVFIQHDFLDDVEKEKLLEGIKNEPWTLSQSGRRKQNYGPKCNFKKMKIQKTDFFGFPKYSQFIHCKFKSTPLLHDFQVIEQCVLEYDPKRGASIDPHIDDCWIWGERIVTVNVLGDTFLTLRKYTGNMARYNLPCVELYNFSASKIVDKQDNPSICKNSVLVRIYMPEKSLIILYGKARYEWEHFVLREDIKNYRLCIAYREFTPPFINGNYKEIGDEIKKIAQQFL